MKRNNAWYVASTGNDQGLIVEEQTGKSIAVSYNKEDAPLIAAAPELLEGLKAVLEVIKQGNQLDVDHDCIWIAELIARAEATNTVGKDK
jgi:hypothetical protein